MHSTLASAEVEQPCNHHLEWLQGLVQIPTHLGCVVNTQLTSLLATVYACVLNSLVLHIAISSRQCTGSCFTERGLEAQEHSDMESSSQVQQ